MPKIKRNQQFHAQEEKIRSYLLSRNLLPNKTAIKIEEFQELLNIAKIEAGCRELEPSQFIRWLLWRFLSARGIIGVEIDKYEPQIMTDDELVTTKEKWIRPKGKDNGVVNYLKVFGTPQQQRILNQ
jgi:hypothetical protein